MAKLNFVLYLALFAVSANALTIKGGPKPVTDEQALAELSQNLTDHLQKLGAQENGPKLELVKIHSATSKTVAGTLWEALIAVNENANEANCSTSLWEKPWENFVKFDVDCGDDKKYLWTTGEQREKRSPQGFGGFGAPAPASRKELDELHPRLAAALEKWAESHPDFNIKLKSIKSGTSQVVSGTNYDVIIEGVNKAGQTTEWSAQVLEKLDGHFRSITLTIPGQQHLLSWE